MLDQWEKEGSSALLGTDKAILISQAYDPSQTIDITPNKQFSNNKANKFADILK